DIILVLRTFPIRVAGNSGPLEEELTWTELRQISGYPHEIAETTTVTGRLRRVARFSFDVVERAVRVNRPTHLAIHGLDYLTYQDFGKTSFESLSKLSRAFIDSVEGRLNVPATFLFTGPANESIIDRRLQVAESAEIHCGHHRRTA
ncbi:MAG TPA: hypothetical protein VK638_57700, partial [Edaphobacter sp.]|nr:hypothetical protein [Edaphobacter sp.]